jgi:hypothetical protein
MPFSPKYIIQKDPHHDGVPRINIYLLRLLYVLMFFVLGKDTWTHILTHKGPWDPTSAVVWCVWTAFATLAGLGIIRPAKMLPMILLEIFYKVLWLILVLPALDQRHPRRLPRRRHRPILLLGNPPHRRHALALRLPHLHLQPKKASLTHTNSSHLIRTRLICLCSGRASVHNLQLFFDF